MATTSTPSPFSSIGPEAISRCRPAGANVPSYVQKAWRLRQTGNDLKQYCDVQRLRSDAWLAIFATRGSGPVELTTLETEALDTETDTLVALDELTTDDATDEIEAEDTTEALLTLELTDDDTAGTDTLELVVEMLTTDDEELEVLTDVSLLDDELVVVSLEALLSELSEERRARSSRRSTVITRPPSSSVARTRPVTSTDFPS
jgi:hypothetical protein